jgi:hypothetical protein
VEAFAGGIELPRLKGDAARVNPVLRLWSDGEPLPPAGRGEHPVFARAAEADRGRLLAAVRRGLPAHEAGLERRDATASQGMAALAQHDGDRGHRQHRGGDQPDEGAVA